MIPFYSERRQKSNISEYQQSEQLSNNSFDEINTNSDTETENINNLTDSSQQPPSDTNISSPGTPNSTASTSKSTRHQQHNQMAQVLKNYFQEKIVAKSEKKPDHLQKFFEAMQETVRTFSPHLQIEIKSKISNLVTEYEVKNLITNQNSNRSPNNSSVQCQTPYSTNTLQTLASRSPVPPFNSETPVLLSPISGENETSDQTWPYLSGEPWGPAHHPNY